MGSSGTVHPLKARATGFGGGNPTHCLQKQRRDSILSEQRSKINETFDTTFACCRCKCIMLHNYGEK